VYTNQQADIEIHEGQPLDFLSRLLISPPIETVEPNFVIFFV